MNARSRLDRNKTINQKTGNGELYVRRPEVELQIE